MKLYLTIAGVALASLFSFFFSSLTYSLREYSRQRLAEFLGRHDGDKWFEPVTEHTADLAFLTAVGRQLSNITAWILIVAVFEQTDLGGLMRYSMMFVVAAIITIFFSIAVPHAAARYAAAEIVGFASPLLTGLYWLFSPTTRLMHETDDVVRRALGAKKDAPDHQDIEDDILSAVEEGEKEGVVKPQEREMIESIMEFAAATVGQIMTPRQDIAAASAETTLSGVKSAIEASGHSRIPVYSGSLDHVIGFIHARDLMKYVGANDQPFDLRQSMRPVVFVPETKPLRDLLNDFRAQKTHIAIVLDEYGSTAGLVTIEDILEELVGEISDEHEPSEPAMFKKLDERSADVDARIPIEQLNRLLGISLPEDAGYETLGGFLTTALSHIPEKGATLEQSGVRYSVLDSEPHRIKRVKVEFISIPSQAKSA
jgi:CBS domain containing-hemolysin-like protein